MKHRQESLFHSHCFACGSSNSEGLQLKFRQCGESIFCTTTIRSTYQSYQGIAHGGMITTLLDAAMVRCLYSLYHQHPFTCHLEIRFRHAVPTNVPIDICAHAILKRSNLCIVEAAILKNDRLYVQGRGKFMLKPSS